MTYSQTEGQASPAPARWPSPEELVLHDEQATLLLFAHPRCACTRASLQELSRLVADVGGALGGYILFQQPFGFEQEWGNTDLRRAAEELPGFKVLSDTGGTLSRAFGAETSGQVLLYDAAGGLVFQGGLTSARAHEGDNRGRDAIRQFVNEGEVLERKSPVYGCQLRDEACLMPKEELHASF